MPNNREVSDALGNSILYTVLNKQMRSQNLFIVVKLTANYRTCGIDKKKYEEIELKRMKEVEKVKELIINETKRIQLN